MDFQTTRKFYICHTQVLICIYIEHFIYIKIGNYELYIYIYIDHGILEGKNWSSEWKIYDEYFNNIKLPMNILQKDESNDRKIAKAFPNVYKPWHLSFWKKEREKKLISKQITLLTSMSHGFPSLVKAL